ncbi:AEC family transporter [Paucilactobacillus suebicus]|uniref:Malate transport protein n=1 Tax=Paucilactobacillus suebicus DSM 5007 = KCTC 3549 TaxID=1423807 RepID=A0A0R1W261_9LACO|nr:AEC family transporter [Paucilactobacillus suebicus]KRM11653.1 malate transport protein [Paucilactobacillus suebicus DSM 5007 = KCTC 3549]
MGVFLSSVSGVFVILVMVAIGYILNERGWFDENSTRMISKLVTQVALPAYMVTTIMKDFTAEQLKTLLPDLRYPVISMLILFAASTVISRAVRIKSSHVGLFESMFFNSNTVFVGLPINLALFGDRSLPYVLVYYMANTTFFWTLGVWLIQRDGMGKAKINLLATLKKIFSPPLMGFIIGIILVVLHIKLPSFLQSDLTYVGGLTIPMSMLFIGIAVSNAGISRMRFNRDSIWILIGRFLCAPALMALLVIPSHMEILMKQVFILQAAMPVMTNAPVVSKLYDADADYAAIMVTETTLMSIIVVPILMVVIKSLV